MSKATGLLICQTSLAVVLTLSGAIPVLLDNAGKSVHAEVAITMSVWGAVGAASLLTVGLTLASPRMGRVSQLMLSLGVGASRLPLLLTFLVLLAAPLLYVEFFTQPFAGIPILIATGWAAPMVGMAFIAAKTYRVLGGR